MGTLARAHRRSVFTRRALPRTAQLGVLPFAKIVLLAAAAVVACVSAAIHGFGYRPQPIFVPAPEPVMEIDVVEQ